MITKKKHFELQGFRTFNGQEIPLLQVGWESWGTLNERADNAILVTHYFSGNSHAAGRYHPDDALPGYWDDLIGPGKPLDTNRWFVISSDTLVNQEPFNPQVVTTGPASINPETGRHWGLDFPVVTIRDFVNVQKALLASLGIHHLHAVVGPSMGSLQALEWAVAWPEQVERMISVIGMGESDAWTCLGLQQWAWPIRHDPRWRDGDYYLSEPPLDGVLHTLLQIGQTAMSPEIINRTFHMHHPLEQGPLQDIREDYRMVRRFHQDTLARARQADANHLLYLIRANQLFLAGHGGSLEEGLQRVQARCLFLPASGDLLLRPGLARRVHDTLQSLGKSSHYAEIKGSWGHLDGIYTLHTQHELIRQHLEE
ncbi:E22 family MetX-like putative esterase [Marinospirillum alkaliphilum]|uniref:Probable acyltransferase n=1 Tax=Marinospirillum alkaliphilum DSM 21637 TaxID=1122209 RepID=A0A1K1XNC9_9GAMM|nr:homoserine O-acetyltransferase [Marinospirillum alkaliphilum DSM 21637]